MSKILFFPKGSLVYFTTGEYSDYLVHGVFQTLVDCDLPALAKQYIENDKEAKPDDFPSWLVSKQYVDPVDATEVWLGSYGRFRNDLTIKEAGK